MNKNTKEYLINNCKLFEADGILYQAKPRAGNSPIILNRLVAKHKYGKDVIYDYTTLYDYKAHRCVIYSIQQLLYIWYKGDIPKGYDVDHIDGNTLNNNIDNLQLLTHSENVKKRGIARNQYCCNKSEEQILKERQEREEYATARHNRMLEIKALREEAEIEIAKASEIWHNSVLERDELDIQIKLAKKSRNKSYWHKLISEKEKLNEQIEKNNQNLKLIKNQFENKLNFMRAQKKENK